MIRPVANDGIQWLETRYTIIFSDFDKMQEHVLDKDSNMVQLWMADSSITYNMTIIEHKHRTREIHYKRRNPKHWESTKHGNCSN